MPTFSLSSKYLSNLKIAVEKFPAYKEHTGIIVINDEIEIKMPIVVVASISSKISQIIEQDPTTYRFPFSVNANSNQSLEKIVNVITKNENVEIDSDDDINAFASFGLAIGNEDFIFPLRKKLSDDISSINCDKIVAILKAKKIFNIKDTTKETRFVAENFEEMIKREDFLSFAKDDENIDIIEEIISSSELKICDEDSLLSFLLSICRSTGEKLYSLFSHVLLEYCSIDKCNEFFSFIDNALSSKSLKSLFSCIKRRLVQPKIPMEPAFIEKRHTEKYQNIINDDNQPLNGILRREHQKSNVLLEPSSTGNDDVYDIIDGSYTKNFRTDIVENSFVTASLKDGKLFVISNYVIKGNFDFNDRPKNWILEGQKTDGNWTLLDKRDNISFDQNKILTFPVSCKEKLKAMKITMKGKNTGDNFEFRIQGFDIFGRIYNA